MDDEPYGGTRLPRGGEVVILGRNGALTRFDPDLVAQLVAYTMSLGVDVRLESAVTGVAATGSAWSIQFRGPNGRESVTADVVVHAAGRVPQTRHLDLDRANMELDEQGAVNVNQYLQSVSNPNVYVRRRRRRVAARIAAADPSRRVRRFD